MFEKNKSLNQLRMNGLIHFDIIPVDLLEIGQLNLLYLKVNQVCYLL